MVPLCTRQYLDAERMHGAGGWEGKTDWCFEELKQAMRQRQTQVIPFVECSFWEPTVDEADRCFAHAQQCPPPVDRMFAAGFVGESEARQSERQTFLSVRNKREALLPF